jgi:hypothetical protein
MSTLEALKQLKVQVPTTSCLNYSQHLIGALPDLPLGPSAARVILLKPSVRLLTLCSQTGVRVKDLTVLCVTWTPPHGLFGLYSPSQLCHLNSVLL